MKKIILTITLALLLSITACGKDKTSEITIVLDWVPNTNHTGLFVAEELGYYEDEGLKVNIMQSPEFSAETLVGSGKANFGISFQEQIAPALVGENKLPITAVAAIINHNTSGIISRAGEGLDRPRGLENKKYATWDLPLEQKIIKTVMEKDGADYDKLTLIPSTVTDETSALKSKSVDAIWVYYAWAGVATELAGLETDYFEFREIDPVFDFYSPIIIANNDFLKNSPELAKKFLKATKKGYEYSIENPTEAADILCKLNSGLDNDLARASQVWLADKYVSDSKYWGYIDADRWNNFYGWINEMELLDEDLPENIGFTNDFLSE